MKIYIMRSDIKGDKHDPIFIETFVYSGSFATFDELDHILVNNVTREGITGIAHIQTFYKTNKAEFAHVVEDEPVEFRMLVETQTEDELELLKETIYDGDFRRSDEVLKLLRNGVEYNEAIEKVFAQHQQVGRMFIVILLGALTVGTIAVDTDGRFDLMGIKLYKDTPCEKDYYCAQSKRENK